MPNYMRHAASFSIINMFSCTLMVKVMKSTTKFLYVYSGLNKHLL